MCKPYVLNDDFYIAIGKLTIGWQTVEIPLDVITGILFWHTGGPKKNERGIPRSLDLKLEFCRKTFRDSPRLGELKDGAKLVLEAAKNLSTDRHRLTHGLVDNVTPVHNDVIIINKIKYEKDRHIVETFPTSFTEIVETLGKINGLASAMSLLLKQLCKEFGIKSEVFD